MALDRKISGRTHAPTRFFAAAAVLAAAALAAPGSSAPALAAAPKPPVVVSGGMVAGAPGAASSTARALVSCRAVEYRGSAGKIAVQTSPSGYVAWGIYFYDPAKNDGPWVVDVYVGSRRVDHKKQNYAPHGSVHPNDARSGATFRIKAEHADLQGNVYHSVPNACVIP